MSAEFVLNTCIRISKTGLSPQPEFLSLVFDRLIGIEGRTRATLDACLQHLTKEAEGLPLNTLRFEDSALAPPIQAADMLAYESYKELRSRREQPPRPVSRALERLVMERPHIGYYIDERFILDHQHVAPVEGAYEISPLLLFTEPGRLINPQDGLSRNAQRGY